MDEWHRAVFKYVFNFFRDTGAISIKQSGFKPGDSTVYQLTHLYHIFSEALDKQKDVRLVFCDISKAFDRVWHPGLLSKLSKVGIVGKLLLWFQNYLSDRSQRVVVNGQESSWGSITAGVPQGSVLGPLLFLIYINDITDVVEHSQVRLFADDTILYLFVDNPATTAEALNEDLRHITEWADNWLIKFSPSKTKSMRLSRKHKLASPPLTMGGTILEEVKSHKHLGVTLSNDLSWNSHIEDIVAKASQSLDVLNALKYKLDRVTLDKLYKSFIRSKLEYANITWDNCSKYLSDLIESVQYRAAKIVSGGISRVSHNAVYSELGWESLKTRRQHQRLKVFFKAVHDECPSYLCDTIPDTNQNERYQLRNSAKLSEFQCRTQSHQNSFFPLTTKQWNELPDLVKDSQTVHSFMSSLKDDIKKPPSWFNTGKRYYNSIHARLRMLCSPLNDHLFSFIHVKDSPTCACGHPRETNKHFLLECPLFAIERARMLTDLYALNFEPTVTNLLYGDKSLSNKTNSEAVLIIHRYLIDSSRFDSS